MSWNQSLSWNSQQHSILFINKHPSSVCSRNLGIPFLLPHSLPCTQKISFFNPVSTLHPFTPHHHASPPTQLWYLCCILPSINRPRQGQPSVFCSHFTLFIHSSPMEISSLPIYSIIRAIYMSASTPSLFLQLWPLFQAPNIGFNCLISPPGLDPKQKASSFPVPNFSLYSYHCYGLKILETKLFIFPLHLNLLGFNSTACNKISKSQWLQQGHSIFPLGETSWNLA